jgi:hypothetical protein
MAENNPDRDQDPAVLLKEGTDYYLENGLIVLTERYLNARGYCCGSGCRHCPYEHINVPDQSK